MAAFGSALPVVVRWGLWLSETLRSWADDEFLRSWSLEWLFWLLKLKVDFERGRVWFSMATDMALIREVNGETGRLARC